jgi:hypothetical protein
MTESRPERRITRRFALRLPLIVSFPVGVAKSTEAESRDVSARGICFYVDAGIPNGSDLEFTLILPQEITGTESIRVRCKGKVVRQEAAAETAKTAVAAVIHEYEFLTDK